MLPEDTITIPELISSGKAVTISYRVLSFIDILSNGTEGTILNVVNDYMPELKDICMNVKLSTEEYRKYAYKPKLLAYDLYSNTELYYIIMLINDMIDVKEFTRDKLLLPKPSLLNTILTNIYNAEYKSISTYNSKKNTTTAS